MLELQKERELDNENVNVLKSVACQIVSSPEFPDKPIFKIVNDAHLQWDEVIELLVNGFRFADALKRAGVKP